ncbi:MAG: hypothetical protein LBV52_01480 [Spirochaetaceae bacterium]|jgi:hypothetical protein|nr:hypothetical protein [Spirochaetaceae bacterium]
MHGSPAKKCKVSFCFVIFLLACCFNLNAQNFKPFQRLFSLQTVYFDIIYTETTRETAYKLAARCDELYEYVSGMLGITLPRRVPVSITADTDEHNGYMNPVPYPHIVLFDTLTDLEWTSFTDSLLSLFLHEMTHAVSASTRGPVSEGLYSVFGGWSVPIGLSAPEFMIEGIAVSFESLDGQGRANDPLIKQRLRQDIYEDKFKTPYQAAGVYDLPPGGNVFYDYGGLFSAYLQKTYGMEKYAQLWQNMGRQFHLSFSVYNTGFYNIIKKVYQKDIKTLWNDFKNDIAFDGIEKMQKNDSLIYGGKSIIKDIVSANDGKIYFIDTVHEIVVEYDPVTGKSRRALSVDNSAYAIDISNSGETILISSFQRNGANSGQLSVAIVYEYNVKTGFKTGRYWKGLYSARYFNEGLIGLASSLHNGNIVYRNAEDKTGKDELVLLYGNEELLFSSPSPVSSNIIAFTSAKKGVRELSLLDIEDKKIYSLYAGDGDKEIFRFMRGLRYRNNQLVFSINADDRMYKPFIVQLDALSTKDGLLDESAKITNIGYNAIRYKTDISGAVLNPVVSGGEIFYKASFSVWDAFMQYPADDTNTGKFALKALDWAETETNIALNGNHAQEEAAHNGTDFAQNEKPYFPLKYLNPLNFWVPYPVINPLVNSIYADGETALSASGSFKNIHFDGAGLFFFASDTSDDNLFFVNAAYDGHHNMALLGLTWYNFNLTFPVLVNLHDSVDESYEFRDGEIRITGASVNLSKRFPLGNERTNLILSGTLKTYWYFWQDTLYTYTKPKTAYTWPLQQQILNPAFSITFSTMQRFSWQLFGSGISWQFYVDGVFDTHNDSGFKEYPRYATVFSAAAEEIPFFQNIPFLRGWSVQNIFYSGIDQNGMNIHGSSSNFQSTIFSGSAPYEYDAYLQYFPLRWIVGGEFSLKPFSGEIQNNLWYVYLNRFWTSIGYRWAYYGDQNMSFTLRDTKEGSPLLHSLIIRAGLEVSFLPITIVPLKVSINALYAIKLSELQKGNYNNVYYAGFSLGASL